MPDRPVDPTLVSIMNNALERLRAVERRTLQLPEDASPLQTFEDGSPLGDTRFLSFGEGLVANLVGDDYVEVTGTGGDGCGVITPTVLTSGSGDSPLVTASVTMSAATLITLTINVQTARTSPGDNPPAVPPVITGFGGRLWKLETSQSDADPGNLFRETLFLFSSITSAAMTGAGTITYTGPPPAFLTDFDYEIIEWENGGWIPQVGTDLLATQCSGVTYGAISSDAVAVTAGTDFEALTTIGTTFFTEWSSFAQPDITFTGDGSHHPTARIGAEIALGTVLPGHIIQDEAVSLAQRGKLDFAGAGVTVTNTAEKTLVTIPATATINGHVVEDEGTPLAQQPNLNFVGAGVTVTDSAPDTIVTIPGGAGHVIEDEGVPLPAQPNLNFVGAGVTVTDSAPDTIVTISGGGGGGGDEPSAAGWMGM